MRLTINFHHDGNFVPSPLMYQEGHESTIDDIDFEGMTVARLSKMLQGTCMFLVKGIFFLVTGKELTNGLIQIKNDLDPANCIVIGYKNGKVIDMFLEHHGYDLSHWIQTDIDNNDDEISDVEMEDITGYAVSDFVGEDDVVIPNGSINDLFLNKLCNGSYINDFSDKPDVGESSQACGKELEIDSDDEDVGKQFKLVDGGLMKAVKNLLPYAEHRKCARHIYANFKKKWNGLHFKNLFWGAAVSTVQHNFYSKMNLIGNIDPEAKQWLVDRNPNSWCRAFFRMDRGYAAYENGIFESYHNSIRIARGKPLITMLEEIRVYLMQRLYSMHNLAANLGDNITPSIRKEIKRLKHSRRYWTVYPCGNNVFELRKGDDSSSVNIDNKTCACKWWDLSGVPCVHSVAAFSFLKNHPILGVSAWYSKKMWQNAYSYFIKPVGGSSMWPQTLEGPPLPPVLRKMTDGGDADPSSAGPNVGDPSFAGPSVADPSSACLSVADPSFAGPSVADSTGSGTRTITEDLIVADPTNDIPTQQSKTSDTAKIIEDVIATGRLKTAGLKRMCKSERIAKRAKAFQFGKDGAGSCPDKA
uniref:SWIM-type domain-containing protein n=1 Tax=Tanacetum cinerariifolium TaxID=118510 RepID=A0A6L2L299_TANCI|nr:hypothetical protein CTI12_AA204890 [Tanacetum cinerariifolium]